VPARRLIVVFAALTALLDVVFALPGGPSFAPGASVAFSLLIEALLIWRLWHASVFAWFLLVVGGLITLPLFFLMGLPSDGGSIAGAVLALAQLAILLTPRVLKFVWAGHGPAMAA